MRFTEYVSRFSTKTIVVLTVIVSLICLLPIIMLSNRHDSTKIYPKPNSLVYRNGVNELKDNLHASNADSSNYEEEDSKREVLPDNTARKYTLDDEHKNIIEPSSNTGSPTPSVDLTYSPMPHTEPSDSKVNHIHPNHDHHHRTTEDSEEKDVSDEDSNDNRCGICLSNLDDPTKTVTGECRHTYHTNCIKTWIKQKNTCPLCIREWKPKVLVAENLKAVLIKMLRKPPNKLKLSLKRAMELAGEFTERLKANKDLDDKERFEADLSVSPDKSKLVKMFSNLIRNDGNVGQSMIENDVFNILNSCLDDMYPVKWQFLKNGNWHEFDDAVTGKVEGHYNNHHDQAEPAIVNFY
eukprot:91557_1